MSKVIDMGGNPPKTEMKIDASDLDDIICEECINSVDYIIFTNIRFIIIG